MSVAADSPSPSLLREAEESVVPLVELCCEEAQQQNEVDANCRHQKHQMSAEQQQNGRRMAAPQFVSWLCLRRARRARCRHTEERQFENASYLQMMRYANKWDWLLLVVGTTTALVCTAISTAVGSLISRGITDVLMEGQNYYVNGTLDMEHFYAGMIHHVLEFCVLGIFTLLSTQMSLACFAVLCERQIHRIRCALFQALMAQEPAWFDRSANQVGALTQKMSAGLDRIRAGMSDKLANILTSCSACSAGIAIGAYMSWKMALIMMGTFPFVALVFWGTTRSASSAIRKEMAANAAAGAVADEVLGGIRTVTAFNAQHAELARYKMHLESSQQIGIRKSLVMAFFAGLLLFVMFARLSVALWYGTTLVLQGDISPGTVFACYWAVAIGTMRIVQAFPQFSVVVGAKLAAGEIFSIIDRKPALDLTGPSGVRPSSVRGRIELCNVHFAYPTRPEIRVLNNVTLTIEAGESIAFVGHSGCGKSTLVGLLMRFYCPTQGFITLDGVPIQELNVQWLREQVGLVQQEPVLFAGTVEENLRMGRENVTRQEMVAACRMANAHNFIQKLPNGYKTLVGQGGIQLSGGQKQRVAIARMLVRNPRILLLDEATSALDAESEQLVQEAIEQASAGRTTITIAHRLSTVRNADRICVFEHGRLVECGSHDELMARPESTYRRLVLAQQIEQERPSAIQGEDDDDEFFATAAECEPNASEGGVPEAGLGDSSPSERTAAPPLASQLIRRRPSAAPSSAAGNAEADQEKPIHPYDGDDELDTRPASVGDILRYARPEMCMIVFGVLLALIRGASSPLFTVIYGRLFLVLSDSLGAEPAAAAASTQQQRDTLRSATIVYALAIVGVGLMSGLATFGSGALLGIVGEKLTQRLRLEVFRNILAQDGYFFDRPRYAPGKLTVRLATDAPNVQAAIDQRLAELLQGIVSLVACVSIAFYFGWNVAPIGLMVAVVLVLLQVGTTNYLKRRGMRDMQATEDTNRVATESLEYVRTVQALNRQQSTCRRFSESAKRPHTLAITRGLWTSLSMALTNSFVPLSFGVIYFLGLLLIQHGHTTPFILFQVVEALNGASYTFMAASAYFPEYLRAKISAGLMFAMARLRPRIDNLSEAGLEQPISGRIGINSVHFAYPNAKKCLALNGLSLEVAAGTRVALVGPSGCGKSTLMQLLERFYDPTRGQLCVDGVDTCRYNVRHLRRNMALVGQEPTLFNMSIRDNIGYGLARHECPEERIQWAARLANIHAFVESLPLGYNTPVGARGTQLSGGQKQRIAIARAIVRDPRILLLDEATSALDTESEKAPLNLDSLLPAVQEALDRASEGRTSVVIAHRLSTIQSADLIVVVRDGRVIEQGTHQELLRARGLYYRLVQRQSGAQ